MVPRRNLVILKLLTAALDTAAREALLGFKWREPWAESWDAQIPLLWHGGRRF